MVKNGNFTIATDSSSNQEWNFTLLMLTSSESRHWQLHRPSNQEWNFTLLLTSSDQEWQFHIATDI